MLGIFQASESRAAPDSLIDTLQLAAISTLYSFPEEIAQIWQIRKIRALRKKRQVSERN